MPKTISFIGTGKMATALISCIHESSLGYLIIASDKDTGNLNKIKSKFNLKTTADNKEAAKNSDIVFICVKPQDIDDVLIEIKNEIRNHLVVSIAAGIKTKHIESMLGKKRVIRVMPNINCLVGEMAAGFSAGKHATKYDIKNVKEILDSAGISFFIREDLIDALSVVSGAGPAFFAYFIQAIAEAGIKKGLPGEIAYKLAAKTALGTGKLILEKNLSPEDVIKMVASKKGVTLEGLKVLNKYKVKAILEKTVNAAHKRSRELGK